MSVSVRSVTAVMLVVAIYHFYIALTGVPEPMMVRPIHVSALIFLGFLLLPFRTPKTVEDGAEVAAHVPHWFDWVLAILGLVSAVYILNDYERLTLRLAYLDPLTTGDWVVGVVTIALIIELARRVVGLVLPVIIVAFGAFTLLGPYLPGFLSHQGAGAEKFLDHIFLTSTGVYGSLASLSLSIVFMFIAFGAFLQAAGGERLLSQIIISMTRGRKGGPGRPR
ncbi:hypothetical protein [Halomonas ramblicola]|uniref:hypothetical protein n=1 Tax=Halomonas ramblicola TaxID=747349 RepID=UPI0025B5C932|nr:hypothetical protein [Halomonas ramblicola]MDN3522376.1 hypothetical protein [Halomonas ramblicola]